MLNIDAILENTDWTKQTWDLPFEYGSKEFLEWLKRSGMSLGQFKRLPVYKHYIKNKRSKNVTSRF